MDDKLSAASVAIIVLLSVAVALFIVVLGLLIWDLSRPRECDISENFKDIYSLLALKMYDLTDLMIEYLSNPKCAQDIIEQINGNINIIISSTANNPTSLRRKQLAWRNLIIAIKDDHNLTGAIEALSQEYFNTSNKINADRLQNLLYNWVEFIKLARNAKAEQNCIAAGLSRKSALENSADIAKVLLT